MMEGSNYSLSDIAAITGENGLGGSSAWLIILFVLIFGAGGWNRQGDFSAAATAASQNEILLGQKFGDLDNKIDRGFTSIGNGISDATYALNNAISTEGRTAQKNIDDLRYEMAQGFCAVKSEGAANTQRILDEIHQDRVRQLEQQVQALQGQVNMAGVVRYPMQSVYSSGANPFCGCNNGCPQV